MDFQKYNELFSKDSYPSFTVKDNCYLPEDEGQCICLSGNKYKDCCKKEVQHALSKENNESDIAELKNLYDQKESKLLSYKVTNKAINKKNISYCSAEKVFENCDSDSNVKSHTMSRGNVLKNLAGNGNKSVISFNDHIVPNMDMVRLKNNIDLFYKDILIEDASLTVAFCKKHDRELFMDIETDGKTEYVNLDIQNLEYALKAVTFDIYYKLENIQYMALLVKKNKNVLSSFNGESSPFLKNYYIAVRELFLLYPLMKKILNEIKEFNQNRVVSKLKTVYFELPIQKVNISCSEVIEKDEIFYFINVINSSKPYMIFSYYDDSGNDRWIKNMKNKFEKCNDKMGYLYKFFLSFLIVNAQNIYINKNAFDRLTDVEKIYLYVVHREGTANIPDEKHISNCKSMCKFLFDK